MPIYTIRLKQYNLTNCFQSIEHSHSLNMSPHLIRSFLLAVLFSTLTNAEPCKPNEVIDGVEIFTTTTTTTTSTAQVTHSCIDNKLSPPPKDLLCGVEGNSWTRDDWIEDETKFEGDELDCLARCFKARKEGKDCVLFEVQKGAMCWLYVTTDHQLDHSAVVRLYEPGCFCDVPNRVIEGEES